MNLWTAVTVAEPHVLSSAPPVVVLIDDRTASSGEAIAIAFKGARADARALPFLGSAAALALVAVSLSSSLASPAAAPQAAVSVRIVG